MRSQQGTGRQDGNATEGINLVLFPEIVAIVLVQGLAASEFEMLYLPAALCAR
jgi:hypothetical protein